MRLDKYIVKSGVFPINKNKKKKPCRVSAVQGFKLTKIEEHYFVWKCTF